MLFKVLNSLPEDDNKNLFLLKYFILYHLNGWKYRAYHDILTDEYGKEFYAASGGLVKSYNTQKLSNEMANVIFCFSMQFIHLIVSLGIVFYALFSIGNLSTSYWLLGVIFTFLFRIFLFEPLIVWVNYTGVLIFIRNEIISYRDILHFRAKSILKRKRGAIRNVNSCIQHFNPACRVARR